MIKKLMNILMFWKDKNKQNKQNNYVTSTEVANVMFERENKMQRYIFDRISRESRMRWRLEKKVRYLEQQLDELQNNE